MSFDIEKAIARLGFESSDAFLRWQLTQYLLLQSAELEARIRAFRTKYACDFESFEQRFSPENEEKFEEWDDSIDWLAAEHAFTEVKSILDQMLASQLVVWHKDSIMQPAQSQFSDFISLKRSSTSATLS